MSVRPVAVTEKSLSRAPRRYSVSMRPAKCPFVDVEGDSADNAVAATMRAELDAQPKRVVDDDVMF